MKILFTTLLAGLTLSSLAQTVVSSMQTTDNEKILSMNVVGTHAGRPFRHRMEFDMAGLTPTQRDSLHQQVVQALNQLGIADVPGLKKRESAPATENSILEVVFRCETCTGKGKLQIYGDGGFVITRSFNTKRDAQPFFPYTARLGSGPYRLVYIQNGVRQIQSDFKVKAGGPNVVMVK
jgi:hypothetical protein